jgi:hypothetical protein
MNMLAQIAQTGNLTSILVQLLILIGVIVIVGIVFTQLNVRQYIPDWAWQILTVVAVIAVALWAIRTFF